MSDEDDWIKDLERDDPPLRPIGIDMPEVPEEEPEELPAEPVDPWFGVAHKITQYLPWPEWRLAFLSQVAATQGDAATYGVYAACARREERGTIAIRPYGPEGKRRRWIVCWNAHERFAPGGKADWQVVIFRSFQSQQDALKALHGYLFRGLIDPQPGTESDALERDMPFLRHVGSIPRYGERR